MLIGLVGKPNIGKSTFFRAATLAHAPTGNYPFVTIKPNLGKGFVRVKEGAAEFGKHDDPREGHVQDGLRFVPFDLMDVAGLVPGAHEGLGMGNAFLDDLRQADALIHVIDLAGATNEKGEPVQAGSYDPANDIRFLEEELDFWYAGILKKGWEKFARTIQQTNADIVLALAKQLSGLGVTEDIVKQTIPALGLNMEHPAAWKPEELFRLAQHLRKATKPIIIAANKIDVPGAAERLDKLQEDFPEYIIIGCSAESELALKEAHKHGMINYCPGSNTFTIEKDMSDKQTAALEFIRHNVLDRYGSTGIQDIMDKAVFELLGYIALFPGGVSKLEDSEGNVLPDCFLMPPQTTALEFAYRLHTDFGKNFIKAVDVRKKMPVGKDHPLQHRDIIEIMANS
ncbi:MAG: redox-regulated ATPase YchF [Nanoarchaeota archaeon]